ncbi:hypothetical protein [Rhodococcus koreensis]
MKVRNASRVALVAACAAIVGTAVGVPSAGAQSLNGWIGPASVNGQNYLHYSTISNTPLFADTRMYTTFGNALPAYYFGVRSRLFLSGALCAINPAKYNSAPAASITDPTSGDCGPGWYNSHGFVLAKDTNGYQQLVTFPTDPLYWEAGAAAAEVPESARELRTNDKGQTVGSGEAAQSDADLPDLILSYGTKGEIGYIKSADIPAAPTTEDEIRQLPHVTQADGSAVAAQPSVTIPLYAEDGTTVVGEFRVGN